MHHVLGPPGAFRADAALILALALALATALCVPVARALRVGRMRAWLVLASLAVIVAATLAPRGAPLAPALTCDLSRIGPASLEEYLRFDDPILNILLFIPLGIMIGSLPEHRIRLAFAAAALALSPAIEAIQGVFVQIGRACEAGDVFDNTAGLVIGLAIGWLLARALPALRHAGTEASRLS